MTQSGPQFSAAQILEAGRRAEADGRLEHATQFYRHLTDHQPRSPEAIAAREALGRIAQRRLDADAARSQQDAMLNGPPQPGRMPFPTPLTVPASANRPPQHPGQVAVARQLPISIAPVGGRRDGGIEPPEPIEGYRLGRLLARLMGALGWLALVAGLAVLLSNLLVRTGILGGARTVDLPRLPQVLTSLDHANLLSVGLLIAAGSGLIFLGQLARAIFDSANASRALVEFERAKVGERSEA